VWLFGFGGNGRLGLGADVKKHCAPVRVKALKDTFMGPPREGATSRQGKGVEASGPTQSELRLQVSVTTADPHAHTSAVSD
jgi:hypothetical protein